MGISKARTFKRKYEATLKFPNGRRIQSKKPSELRVWLL